MLHDLTHNVLPGTVGLIFGAGAWLGLLENPTVASIVSGVAVALIVAHVLAIFRLFRRVDKNESAVERLLRSHDESERRVETVANKLLGTLTAMDEKLDAQVGDVRLLNQKIERTEKEVDGLRDFRHDVEKSYSVTVSLYRQTMDKFDALMKRFDT